MPIYEYECIPNGHRFEVMQKLSEKPLEHCKVCGEKVKKLISAVGFQLKGGGWYKDGYSSTNNKSASEAPTASSETKKPEAVTPTENKPKETKS